VRPHLREFSDFCLALVLPDWGGVPLLDLITSLHADAQPPSVASTSLPVGVRTLPSLSRSISRGVGARTPTATSKMTMHSVHTSLQAVRAVAMELHQLHACGLAHKSLHPSSILYDAPSGRAQFVDLSQASLLIKDRADGEMNLSLDSIERWIYASPEQSGRANRSIDPRSDLYALGGILHHLLTGRPPFVAQDPLELIHMHLARAPPAILPCTLSARSQPALHAVLKAAQAIAEKLLMKLAEDRYQSTAGLLYDLRFVLSALSLVVRSHALTHSAPPPSSASPQPPLALVDAPGSAASSGGAADTQALMAALSGFQPGRVDSVSTFRLSQKLYGREQQVQMLRDTYARVCSAPSKDSSRDRDPKAVPAAPQLFLISGYSGVGKTKFTSSPHLTSRAPREVCTIVLSFAVYCSVPCAQGRPHLLPNCSSTSSRSAACSPEASSTC